jgi:hypothetical protein
LTASVKLFLEIVVAIILHPIAFLLMLLNLAGRGDMSTLKKTIWAVVGLVWGIGPILYMLVADGALW